MAVIDTCRQARRRIPAWCAHLALGAASAGCASDDGVQGDRVASALQAAELGAAELGFNEDSCASEPADLPLTADSVTSPGAYDHPGCPNQFIASRRVARTQGAVVSATYAGGLGGEFVCEGSWALVAVWKRAVHAPRGAPWVRVGQSPMIQGADGPARDGAGVACRATALVHLPDDPAPADYRVVAQAGWTVTYQPVLVTFAER